MPNMMNINREDLDSFEKCKNYTVSIIECGRIGVPHAYLFAEAGFKVLGVSTSPHIFETLEKGRNPFSKKAHYILDKHTKDGIFTARSDIRKAASESDIIVIATQTAIDRKKKPDYSLLERTCREVGMGMKKGSAVLLVSTTGPGIVENSLRGILEKASGLKAGTDFGLASSPIQEPSMEELGKTIDSPRVVGAVDKRSLEIARIVFGRINPKIIELSNIKTVEATNLFRNIKNEADHALSNELALLCEKLQIDYFEILKAADGNNSFTLPVPGIMNGSNRRDFYLIQEEAENLSTNLRFARLAKKINDEIAANTFHLVKDALKVCGKTVKRAKISVLGVSRHPNTAEPPGVLTKRVISFLKRKVKTIQIYDPFISKKELLELGYEADNLAKVVEKTDCLVVLTGHSKFERLNLQKVKLLAKRSPAIVDVSHVINPLKAENCGFVYRGLGRGVWTK